MITGKEILAIPLGKNDADVDNVRDYLIKLLNTVWEHEEGFSGKRPFGNGGWKHEVYKGLLAAGVVEGKLDSDGYIEELDERMADKLIYKAIAALGYGK